MINDVNRYSMGLRAFQLEYGQMPGDFEEAQDYWPDIDTDNGNGDKILHLHREGFNAWEHLYLAGITNENLDGERHTDTCPSNAQCLVRDVNCPSSAYDHNCWVIMSPYPSWTNPPLKRANGKHWLLLGKVAPASYHNGTIPPKDAYAIDKKFDDGDARTGQQVNWGGYAADCTIGNGGTYDLENSGPDCMLIFGFDG